MVPSWENCKCVVIKMGKGTKVFVQTRNGERKRERESVLCFSFSKCTKQVYCFSPSFELYMAASHLLGFRKRPCPV